MYSDRVFFLLTALMVVTDLAMGAASLALAYYLRFETQLLPAAEEFHSWETYISLMVVQMAVFPLTFAARGVYQVRRNVSRLDEMQRVLGAVAVSALLTLAVVALASRDFPYSRALLALTWLFAVVLIWAARMAQYWVQRRLHRLGLGTERVLLVGSGEVAQAMLQKINSTPDWGYRVVGFVTDWSSPKATQLDSVASLGSIEHIDAIVARHGVTEVIIADPALPHQAIIDIVEQLDPRKVSVKVFPDVFQLISTQVTISDLHGLPLVSVRDAALRGWRFAVKRVVDVVVSAAVLVFLSPFMLLVAFLIKLTSPGGPVFYIQERVGLDNRPFWVIKYRSMRPDAESSSGPVWASPGDPRSTLMGRFLRRFSIDELPQFINVLVGDMSIVGPRPERPHFVQQFTQRIPDYWKRHWEKAGLTGWAQVNGLRGDTSIEERTAYDLWYVENWTLWLDFKIMIRTIPAVFRNNNG